MVIITYSLYKGMGCKETSHHNKNDSDITHFEDKEVFNLTPIFRGIALAKIGDATSTLFLEGLH
jgi:hypothetical protein